MVKRILALDVGERRIGVAVSDLLGITAQGVETIFTEGLERDLKRVGELARRYETDQLLLGLPMRMSGEEGLQAGRVRAFAERLSEMGLQVRFQDERLTSVSAERVLIDAGVSPKGSKAGYRQDGRRVHPSGVSGCGRLAGNGSIEPGNRRKRGI